MKCFNKCDRTYRCELFRSSWGRANELLIRWQHTSQILTQQINMNKQHLELLSGRVGYGKENDFKHQYLGTIAT